jgi:putative ABC transport system permease protein
MTNDLIYALRSLKRRPLVTSVAILSLALGIGVNAAIFSVFDRLLLQRLPVPAPGEVVNVASPGPRPGSRSTSDAGDIDEIFSYPLFRDIEGLVGDALQIAAHRDFRVNLAYRGQTSDAEGVLVSGHYFPALQLRPALGRLLGAEDDRVPGAHPVVVLSHSYWSTRFGSDPSVIDDTLIVNGEPMTIVGVAPEGFSGNTTLDRPQVFVPLAMAERAFRDPQWNGMTARNNHWLYLFARLRSDLSRDQAEALISVPFTALIKDVEYPAVRSGIGSDRERELFQLRRLLLRDGSHGRDANREETRVILLLMFTITGFVLAIACANVANLLLARVADRSAEMSVRLSLGASSSRLIRLLLVESVVLGVLGAAGALIVARMTLSGLAATMPAEDMTMLAFEIDSTVLSFALVVGMATSVVFGLFPAVHGVRSAVGAGLQASSTRMAVSRAANRFRASLATSQVALATALLATAGLFVVSLVNLARTELGIQREGLVTFRLSPYLNGYTRERAQALFDRVEEDLEGVPGVVSVTTSTVPLLANSNWQNNITVEGFDAGPDADTVVAVARVGFDYFRTMGIPMLAGREFTRTDSEGAPRVAVVNEAFGRKFNLGTNVIGKRLAMGRGNDKPLDIEIVGLVRDAKYSDAREPAPPQLVMSYRQPDAPDRQANVGPLTFYVRTTSDSGALLAGIPPLIKRHDANLPVVNLRSMDDQIWDNTTPQRVLGTLSSSFAGVAIVLAAIGLYAVLSYGVAQRLREIGIRMALGAQPRDVRSLVLTQVVRMTVIGGVVGAALAFGLGRLGEALFFGVRGYDAAVVGGAVLLVGMVAAAAGALPIRRATSVNPIQALRSE